MGFQLIVQYFINEPINYFLQLHNNILCWLAHRIQHKNWFTNLSNSNNLVCQPVSWI